MSKYFITIKDLSNNTEYIFNSTQIDKESIKTSFENCFIILNKKHDNLSYNITDNICNIYTENNITKKGWIWNSEETTKTILYTLGIMPIYQNFDSFNTSTQTENIKTDDIKLDDNKVILFNLPPENEPFIPKPKSNSTQIVYGTGYAPSLLFPDLRDQLTRELKFKLASPNYGLRTICPFIHDKEDQIKINIYQN